jgi:hypothetical protein
LKKREIDCDKLIQMYNDGATHKEICDAFDISIDTLRKRIRELGLPRRRQPLSINIEAFRESYYSGLSSYRLSKEFKICRSSVAKIVKELKLREYEINRAYVQISPIAS